MLNRGGKHRERTHRINDSILPKNRLDLLGHKALSNVKPLAPFLGHQVCCRSQ